MPLEARTLLGLLSRAWIRNVWAQAWLENDLSHYSVHKVTRTSQLKTVGMFVAPFSLTLCHVYLSLCQNDDRKRGSKRGEGLFVEVCEFFVAQAAARQSESTAIPALRIRSITSSAVVSVVVGCLRGHS